MLIYFFFSSDSFHFLFFPPPPPLFFTSFELCFLISWPGPPEINPQLINQSVTYNSPLQFNCKAIPIDAYSSRTGRRTGRQAVVSRELISRESSLWGCCEMVSIRLPLTSSSRSAKESPEYNFVICSLIVQAHLSPFSFLLSTLLSSQYQVDEQSKDGDILVFLFS